MLQIKKLTLTHRKDLRILIEDFSFSLNDTDKAVLIGEEGNGKSTLLKLIYNEALVEDYIDYTGEIIKNRTKLGYLAQELPDKEKNMTVYEFMSEAPFFFELSPKELVEVGHQLGIQLDTFYSEQPMRELSGGEKVKLQFARMLLDKPEILLLDEPSNDIDLETLEWLEKFLNTCKLPLIYISHDETLIERTANVVIHVEQIMRKTKSRVTVARMGYHKYVEERMGSLSHQNQIARKERSDYKAQQEKFREIQQKVEHRQNAVSRQDPHGGALLKKTMHRVKAYETRFQKEFETMTELPETEEAIFVKFGDGITLPNGKTVIDYKLDVLWAGERALANNMELIVRGAEKIGIIGRNGCGKTMFIRKLAEELLPRRDIKVSYMPQNYEELLDLKATPVEFITKEGDKEEISRIRTYLGSMKYTPEEMDCAIGDLSGGQKAKLLFLKMSMDGSNVLILDEPTRNFSPLSNPVIRNILRNFGGAIISISHDRKYIDEVCETVYQMDETGLHLC